MIGPLCLAVIAEAGQLVTPAATTGAVTLAFLFTAGCALFFVIAFVFLLPEGSVDPNRSDDREAADRADLMGCEQAAGLDTVAPKSSVQRDHV